MRAAFRSWFNPTPPQRPINNDDAPSKILRVVLATLGIIASFAFFTAELAIIATVVIFGVSYFSLQRINNVYYRTVSPRPLYQRIFPCFWAPREEPIYHRSYWPFSRQEPVYTSSYFWPFSEPTPVYSSRGFWSTRPPAANYRSSSSPSFFSNWFFGPTRAPVGTGRSSPVSSNWGFRSPRAPLGNGRSSSFRTAPPVARTPSRPFFSRTPPPPASPRGGFFDREPTRAGVATRRR